VTTHHFEQEGLEMMACAEKYQREAEAARTEGGQGNV
jgi:hypothetical protein